MIPTVPPLRSGPRSPLRSPTRDLEGGVLPAFIRVEYGMPWGQWARVDAGALVVGAAPGLGLSLVDPSLAPHHAVFRQDAASLVVETLHPSAELRVEGQAVRHARLTDVCIVSLGQTHLRVLPPPRTVEECGCVLQALRNWMQSDPTTGLPSATHLLDALTEGCPGPESECRQALLLLHPDQLSPASARTLRSALPPDTLLCRAGPEHYAAVFPEAPPTRLDLPLTWQASLRSCHQAHHRPEALLLQTREALAMTGPDPSARA